MKAFVLFTETGREGKYANEAITQNVYVLCKQELICIHAQSRGDEIRSVKHNRDGCYLELI